KASPRSRANALLGDQRGNQCSRGDVEGGVVGACGGGGEAGAGDDRHLVGVAVLDGNGGAGGARLVDGGCGGGHVEGDAMVVSQHGERVGADLVGHVAVGGHPVGADDDAVDLTRRHEATGGHVGDDGVG